MSIASEITRIQVAKANLKTAIEGKGVTVPSSTKLDGYADLVDDIQTGSEPNLQDKSVSYTPTESQQTATVTADSGYDGLDEVSITVDAIDSEYVGSDVPRKSSADLTVSDATVNVPSGYYSASASKSVNNGTEGTPTASKGAVSNHSVSVTPSVTNSAGYINGGTKTGSAVSVSASELVSGTKQITANGTEDVTNYASVSVDVPNSYSASDEGKVVDNGALVAQTSATFTENDTYDTTLINSLTVNVSGGGEFDYFDVTQPTGAFTVSLTTIPAYVAYGRKGITSVTAQNAKTVGMCAFQNCTSLTSFTGDSIENVYGSAFKGSGLTSISLPNLRGHIQEGTSPDTSTSAFGSSCFENCTSLVSVSLPRAGYNRNNGNAFAGCTSLVSVDLSGLTAYYGNNFFKGCTSLPSLVLPNFGGGNANFMIGQSWFEGCTSFTTFDVRTPYSIGNKAFKNSSLSVLVIRAKSVRTLGNLNAFEGTPFASNGTGGTLYVPSSILSSYQTASNWSTLLGYTNNSIKSIESTHTDPNAPIDLTTHYADGTLIPT